MLSGIGSQITGFTNISLAAGSRWKLSGNAVGLAAGQQINGFAAGDKIVLDGFAATSDTYVGNIGLVLSNGSSQETLGITGNTNTGYFSTDNFVLTNLGGNSPISLSGRSSRGHVISTIFETPVAVGGTLFSSPLTIDAGSGVDVTSFADSADPAMAAGAGAQIVNHGFITAAIFRSGRFGTYRYGVGLSGSGFFLTNSGSVYGGSYGIDMGYGTINNSGVI